MWGMMSGLDQQWSVLAAQVPRIQDQCILEKWVGLTLQAGGHEKEKREKPSPCWDFEEQHAPVGENQRTAYLSRLLYLTFRLSLWRISLETIPLYESVVSFMWEIYCPLPVTGYLSHMFKYLELLRQYTSLSLCGIFSPTKRKAMNCLRGRISSFSQMTCSKMWCSFF